MLKNLANKLHITWPVVLLIVLFFIANFWWALYAAYHRSPSPLFGLIYFIAFIWLLSWWLKEDNLKYEQKWVYDIGFVMLLGWFIVIPIYLFKTRGIKALASFFKLAIIYFGTLALGIILSLLIKIIYPM